MDSFSLIGNFYKERFSTTTMEYKVGLNTLNDFLEFCLGELGCDTLECVTFNVNLDFTLRIFNKYDTLKKIIFYSNTDQFRCHKNSRHDILDAINNGMIELKHISNKDIIIHAKLFRGWKNGEFVIGAIGSPNFSNNSNQNIESLLCIKDEGTMGELWNTFPDTLETLKIEYDKKIPQGMLDQIDTYSKIDSRLLKILWAHQKSILEWMVERSNMIVNIPPGCGKTKIATTYMEYMSEEKNNVSFLILVPTTTLIDQWLERLETEQIKSFELKNDLTELGEYFANPAKKGLVTLYSRFYDLYPKVIARMAIVRPDIVIIADECHNLYEHLDELKDYNMRLNNLGINTYNVGLSATIDSFNTDKVERYIELMGGKENHYSISLPSFYSYWNDLNVRPCLKQFEYIPIKYSLTKGEMKKYNELSKNVGIQAEYVPVSSGKEDFSAAIKRAWWTRSLDGGGNVLKEYINSHMEQIVEESTIIFVQTNELAEEIRDYLTSHPGWDPNSSAYIYDSTRNKKYLEYALKQFKKHKGFCLISERMLSEGFDIPKISTVILHGSHRSERDWIQKIGRAIRYDIQNPNSIAKIIDVVFCDPNGDPLSLELERYETLRGTSVY